MLKLDQFRGDLRKLPEFISVEVPGDVLQEAEAANPELAAGQQRRAGIKPDMERPGDERTAAEPRIFGWGLDDPQTRVLDRVVTEGDVARRSQTSIPNFDLIYWRLGSIRVVRAIGTSSRWSGPDPWMPSL